MPNDLLQWLKSHANVMATTYSNGRFDLTTHFGNYHNFQQANENSSVVRIASYHHSRDNAYLPTNNEF